MTVFTTSTGVGIHYTETGSPDGRTVMLLHGMGEGGVSWEPLLPSLEAGYRVINVTLRGHAPSDYPGDYSYKTMLLDVCELADAVIRSGSIVVGHSLGGLIAFELAVSRPDLVSALIVEDAAPGPPTPPRELPPRPDVELPFDWDMLVALRPQIDAGAVDLLDQLPTVEAPTLVIGGGETSHVPQEWLAEAVRRIPDAELAELGGGHDVHTAKPEEFTKTVLAWLEAHPTT